MMNLGVTCDQLWTALYRVAVLLLLCYMAVRVTSTTKVYVVNSRDRIAISQLDRTNPLYVRIDQPSQHPIPVAVRQPLEVRTVE